MSPEVSHCCHQSQDHEMNHNGELYLHCRGYGFQIWRERDDGLEILKIW